MISTFRRAFAKLLADGTWQLPDDQPIARDACMSNEALWWPARADELAALDDEIACLVRARIPLIEGLREVAQDHPERLSRIATWLAAELERGVELADARSRLAGGAAAGH